VRKLDLGSLADRVAVSSIGDKVRSLLRARTGEEIAADLSFEQVTRIRQGIDRIVLAEISRSGGDN